MRVRGKRLSVTVFFISLYLIVSVQADNIFSKSTSVSEEGLIIEKDTLGPYPLTLCSPVEVGMNPVKLSRIDSIVTAGIRAEVFPGCQVLVMKNGKTVYDKSFGNFTYADTLKVQPTTMYDLASLSKTTGTLMAVMKLYDNGLLRLTDKVSRHLLFLKGTDKESITLQQLLVHESGLPAYIPFYQMIVEKRGKSSTPTSPESSQLTVSNKNHIPNSKLQYKEGMVAGALSAEYRYQIADSVFVSGRLHETAMQSIARAKLGARIYNYSCVNFILLKEVVETISGMPMDEFLDREFYSPMQLNHMAYLPLRKFKKEQLAPTLKMDIIRQQGVQGYVHDMDAALLGGVSGNAGLFASAGDVATVYQMLLNGGELNGRRYLGGETCRVFTTTTSASGRRGLGFDKPAPSSKSNPCCVSAPKAVYGHTGYTGTCCWVDPENQLVYVFLSNRTFPYDGVNKLAKTGIRTKIQDVIYQSLKN